MLLAACFGLMGQMQTVDSISNNGSNYINLFLRQFCISVQQTSQTIHHKNQNCANVFIL